MEKDFKVKIVHKDGEYKITSNAKTNDEHWEIIDSVAMELTRLSEDRVRNESYLKIRNSKIHKLIMKNTIYVEDLRNLDLSVRTLNVLLKGGIESVYQLISMPLKVLKSLRGFRAETRLEVKIFLESLGLHFEMTDEEVKKHFFIYYLKQNYSQKDERSPSEGIGFIDLINDENDCFRINVNDPVTEFQFSSGTLKVFEAAEIYSFEDLINFDLSKLVKYRGCGPKVCIEVEAFLMLTKLKDSEMVPEIVK